MKTVRWVLKAAVVMSMVLVAPTLAAAQQTALYELTENMSLLCEDGQTVFTGQNCGPRFRFATAQLQGQAAVDSRLCPPLVSVLSPGAKTCTVTATGNDLVQLVLDLVTGEVLGAGLGTVWGTYAAVIQGDNAVDSPELVVQTGSFSGDIDLSPTVNGIPLGTITNGTFKIDSTEEEFSFTGTFRLPFAMSADGKKVKPVPGKDAFYLGDDGSLIKVKQNERALGFPTVRFEVNF